MSPPPLINNLIIFKSKNLLNQKEEEIKSLKYDIEQLRSENESYKSMKNYIEEQNEKRASSVSFKKM